MQSRQRSADKIQSVATPVEKKRHETMQDELLVAFEMPMDPDVKSTCAVSHCMTQSCSAQCSSWLTHGCHGCNNSNAQYAMPFEIRHWFTDMTICATAIITMP